MEIPQWKALAGTKFQTCDPPAQISFDLQAYHPYRICPFSRLHTGDPTQVASALGVHIAAVTRKQSGTRLERAYHPAAWLTCSRNGAWLWFLSAVPGVPKKSAIQALLNFSVQMGAGVSNLAWFTENIGGILTIII